VEVVFEAALSSSIGEGTTFVMSLSRSRRAGGVRVGGSQHRDVERWPRRNRGDISCPSTSYAAKVQMTTVPGGSSDPEIQREAMDLMALLVEQVVDYAIFVINRDGNIASWNPGAQRIKGYAAEDIIGKPYGIFFSAEDRAKGRPQEILSQARTLGRYQEEGWRFRKDGTRFWASVVVTALRDRDGELRGFAKITRDLTERHQAEEAARRAAADQAARRQAEADEREMRRSRDQLDLILRSITEGVIVQDPEQRLVFANDAAARLCAFTSGEEMMTASLNGVLARFEIFREDGTPFPADELPASIALRGSPSTAVVRFRGKDRRDDRWSFVSSAPVIDAAGKVELAVSVFREFTERRRAEQAWQYLGDASAALASNLDYEVTLKQVAELAVPRIADWCGVDILAPDGVLNQLAVAHVDPLKRELAWELRRRWPPPPEATPYRVLKSGQAELLPAITPEMIEASTPDPQQREIVSRLGLCSAMVVPLMVEKRAMGVLSFVTAESDRHYGAADLILATEIARRVSLAIENARAYREAREAIQTRDNFLAVASHELRTPLSALSVLVSSLVRGARSGRLSTLSSDTLIERLGKAERQVTQVSRLVDRLLDVSRLSTHELSLEREHMDMAEVARDVISRFEEQAAEVGSGIELKTVGPSWGWWDRSRIDQVLTNLVGNAVKYAPGSAITVSVSSGSSGNIRLTVEDGGPGISTEDQERIFEQFERAVASESAPGMGLGLWLVRRIVTAHGGAVSIDSAPGRGATFAIVLPVRRPVQCAGEDLPTGR
jgi:PAS domain S-box-containing protein